MIENLLTLSIFLLAGSYLLFTYLVDRRFKKLETNPLSIYQRISILEGKIYQIETHSLTKIEGDMNEVKEALNQRHMLKS